MKKTALLFAIALVFINNTSAQKINGKSWDLRDGALLDGKTILKANMLGWATRNIGFYGERILTKNISAIVGINVMPQGGIPYINNFVTDDPQIENIEIGTFSFTPELRFYLNRSGYGRGFYIAPYYKYERYKVSNFLIELEDENSTTNEIDVSGNLNTHSVGAVIGVQWLLGRKKNIALDWSIIGAHYGSNKGFFNGTSTFEMSDEEQADLKDEITDMFNDIELLGKKMTEVESVNVTSNSAEASTKGPWAFIRASLSIGYRF
ncbi:MAG: DUF3575 domain-containing protein [Bacteroidia bacterium]|nr:DUF3575 domain-containing protein [Bacteroidia bacterium]